MSKVFQMVVDRIIALIQAAIAVGKTLPWRQPWSGGLIPSNWVTRKKYRGINVWLLEPGHEYMTWNQMCDQQKKNRNIHLKKGSKAHFVVFFKFMDVKDKDENGDEVTKRKPFLRYYNVYDVNDIEGIEPHSAEKHFDHEPTEEAERIVADYVARSGIKLRTDGDSAYYRPSTDAVVVPNISRFEQKGEYYSTLFHELVHSTGHPERLNRLVLTAFFGSNDYSKEELVAEMGASMLCGELGIFDTTADNSAAYLQNWLNAIKADPTMLVSAAGKAQRAVDLILGRKFEGKEEEA